jgi:iron(III) transport system permease protein
LGRRSSWQESGKPDQPGLLPKAAWFRPEASSLFRAMDRKTRHDLVPFNYLLDLDFIRRRLRLPGFHRLRRPLAPGPHRPATIIGLAALPVLILLVLYPFAVVVRQSFGQPATLAYWRSLILGQATPAIPFWSAQHSLAFLWLPLQHSLVVAGLTTLLATGLGAGLAWLTTMTDLRYRRILQSVAIFQLILPPFALASAWLNLAKGLRFPGALTHGPVPMVLVLTVHFCAFSFLLVASATRNLDAGMFEAAQVHGAGNRQLMRRIALPLLYPAVLASAGLVAFSALAAFAPMQILGGGRQPYYVLATQIYSLYKNSLGDPRVGFFAVGLALVLTTVSIPPFLLFLRLLGAGRTNWTGISGRGHRYWTMRLGFWREPLSLVCALTALLTVIVPLAILLLQSLSADLGPGFNRSGLTVEHYAALFSTDQHLLSLGNSLLLAALTATGGVLISLPIAYSLRRSRSRTLRGSLYILTFLPFLLPGLVLGLTYFVLISRQLDLFGLPVSLRFLYGSLVLAVVVSLVKHLPFGVQTHLSALLQVDPALEEAAIVFRAPVWRLLRRVLLPLVRNGALAAWLLLFIFVFKEIDVLAFIYAPLAFSTAGLGWQNLSRAPPIMYSVFSLLNSEEHPELYAQGTGLLLLACLLLLGATLLVARLGWRAPGLAALQQDEQTRR